MKKSIFLTLLLLIITNINANENFVYDDYLRHKAKKNGLVPIPGNTRKLLKIIKLEPTTKNKYKATVGQKLFFDPRLSKSGLISCNTCHNIALGGVDGIPVAIGDNWKKNPHDLNSPTVLNAVLNEKQFWDGRSKTLEEQASGPIQASPEMAASPEHVKNLVNSIPYYLKTFRKINNDMNYIPTIKDVAEAIAIYEKTLITPSPYDMFLERGLGALFKEEQKGLNLFIDKGCVTCHNGINLGGGMAMFPVVNKYKYASGDFKGNKNGLVKVPTLRNIDKTAPYFHNGKVWTLREAINIMADTQLGIELTKEEVVLIERFLKSLSGEIRKKEFINEELPIRTEKTELPKI